MNWKELSSEDFSDDQLRLLRITTKHGRTVYETGVVDKEGEIWHHSDATGFPSRYLGNVSQHKNIHFINVNDNPFEAPSSNCTNDNCIDKLAREYSNQNWSKSGITEYCQFEEEIGNFLRWLMQSHCIAEKTKIEDAYNQCKRFHEGNVSAGLAAYDVCMTLEGLFGKENFNIK